MLIASAQNFSNFAIYSLTLTLMFWLFKRRNYKNLARLHLSKDTPSYESIKTTFSEAEF